jgi:hypothetical protein
MHMRIVRHRRAPAVEHGGNADARAKMFGIGGDGERRLGGGLEQEVVDHPLIVPGDGRDRRRQRADEVKIADREQVRFPLGQPFACGAPLALWTMAIAAAIKGDDAMAACAVLAARDMASQRRGSAALDGAHHLQLREADMAGIGTTPCGPMIAEDVRDLQRKPRHGCYAALAFFRRLGVFLASSSQSSGLATAAIMPVATRV